MKLTREQRFLLMRGGHPRIAFDAEKPCPVEVGHIQRLSPRVELEVMGIQRHKRGEWVLEYLIRDDRPTFMRRTPQVHVHQTDQYGDVLPPTPGDIEDARLDSSYTHSTHGAISDAGEALIDAVDQEALTMRARAKWAEREQQPEEVAERQAKNLANKLRKLQADAAKYGVDLAPRLAVMVKEAEREIADKRAA